MLSKFKKIDSFARNIIIVFAGASFANFLGLLYQLYIAHSFSPSDFAAFNALLAVYTLIASPLSTLQPAVVKYSAEYHARNQAGKLSGLLRGLFKKTFLFSLATFLFFLFISGRIMGSLKIPSASSVIIFALLLATAWVAPVFSGGIQGLEMFGWVSSVSVIGGVVKLAIAAAFVFLGFGISGALGALLTANLLVMAVAFFPLRRVFFSPVQTERVDYRGILVYLMPVGISFFCFNALSGFDMALVRSFFSAQESGFYALSQMLGKIFLFLPGAVSIVMFPKTSGLSSRNMDTVSTLKQGLMYVSAMSIAAICFYNLFPDFVLRVLTGKSYPESIFLGRLFSVSMSLFAVIFIFINYFLSIKDLRFVKFLILFTILQNAAIFLFHPSLATVQLILCLSSVLLCLIHMILAFNVGTGLKPVPTGASVS